MFRAGKRFAGVTSCPYENRPRRLPSQIIKQQ